MTDFSIEPISESALLLRFGEGIDIDTNAHVHAAARALRAARLPGIIDIAPAYATVLLQFDPFAWIEGEPAQSFDRIAARLRMTLSPANAATLDPGLRRDDNGLGCNAFTTTTHVIEIPVCYDAAFGADLDAVAKHTGFSHDEIRGRHTAATYTVAMLGFAPGFPYLLGLNPALHVPRRASPRTRVPAGSIAIGGAQTGIYPRELPGGWQLIGRTPLTIFDPTREPACLLAPGDKVRFRAIDSDEFARCVERHA